MTKKLDHEKQAKADRARMQGTESAFSDFTPELTPPSSFKKVSAKMVEQFMREVALAQLERRPPPRLTEEIEYVFGAEGIGLRKLKRDARYQKIFRRLRFRQRRRTSV
jgi:hypothetical protein